MARDPFHNLTVIDEADIVPMDLTTMAYSLIASVPPDVADTFSHEDIAIQMHYQLQVHVNFHGMCRFGPDFIVHTGSRHATDRALAIGFITMQTCIVTFHQWTPEHRAMPVTMRAILRSHRINQHLAPNKPSNEPFENLTVYVTGIPPHLCCAKLLRRLFTPLANIHDIEFLPATLQFRLEIFGQLTRIPDSINLGFRDAINYGDIVHVWELQYQTFTNQMLGRDTPPVSEIPDVRGDSALDTLERWETAIPPSPPENEATSRFRDSSSSSIGMHSDDDSHGWESDRSRN